MTRAAGIAFEPADAVRYDGRSVADRMNARPKDEFGGRNIRVRGYPKIKPHLMFGILALRRGRSVDAPARLARVGETLSCRTES